MIALFARSNHPQGYGFGCTKEGIGGAHGYIVVGVRCKSKKQVAQVVKHIAQEGLDLPDSSRILYPNGKPEKGHERNVSIYGHNSELPVMRWYSGGPGDWDYLFTINGNQTYYYGYLWEPHPSRGDNRFCTVYEASEVLKD